MADIKPQPGFQELVLACTADILINGGSAGPGKTWCNLVEPLFHRHVKGFGAVMFRRTYPEIMNEGGLWDAAAKVYAQIPGSKVKEKPPTWIIDQAKITFSHLQYDTDVYSWLSSEIPLIVFNELTSFTRFQFLFMLTRNRSTCGVKPYVRADCNPDPDSWVKEFIQWWINVETGYPIPERNGVHRFLMIYKDNLIWGDSKEEVRDKCPDVFEKPEYTSGKKDYRNAIKSVTFIAGRYEENKILQEMDPGYEGNLMMQSEEDQKRFRLGNWNSGGDGLGLFDKTAVDNIFSNPVEQAVRQVIGYSNFGEPIYRKQPTQRRYITCDAARFGKDLCVIFVWEGWQIIHVSIFKLSDVHDIHREIEKLRQEFTVVRTDVMVDSDGVGGTTTKFGGYTAFHGGSAALPDPLSKDKGKENYKNLKTQCFYRFANRINAGTVRYSLNNQTCKVFEVPGKGIFTLTISLKGKVWDVRDLIKDDFKAIKRADTEKDGSMYKKTINSKEDQKIILNDRSPDFADTGSMREAFELIRRSRQESEIEVDN